MPDIKRGSQVRSSAATLLQRAYYERTSSYFDEWHLQAADEHHSTLEWIDFLFPKDKIGSILDVGAGTGRAIKFFHDRGRQITGAEPSSAQIAQAVKKGIPPGHIVQADGAALPFPDGSFDAVCEFGMLHHVERPERVIGEMLRVARKAVFISDSNRFGQGPAIVKLGKLALYKLGTWNLAEFLRTGGKGYHVSEHDGLFYSFSVYDHLEQISQAAEHVWLLPVTRGSRSLWFRPLLTHGHVLTCAFKKGFGPVVGSQIS
jgi:SAM-dependent methyltransferase